MRIKKLLIGLPLLLLLLAATTFSAHAHDLGCKASDDICFNSCMSITPLSYSVLEPCVASCRVANRACESAGPFTSCRDQDDHCSAACLSFSIDSFLQGQACYDDCKVKRASCNESQFEPVVPASKPADATPVKPETKTLSEKELQRKEAEKTGKPFATTLEFGTDIKAGDTVKAGRRETVTNTFPDGTKVVLEPGASMKFTSEDLLEIVKGKIKAWVKEHTKNRFQVITPSAVCAVRGTEFTIDATNLRSIVRTYDGIVDVSDKNGKNTVEAKAGYQVTVTKAKVGKATKILPSLVKRWKAQNAQAK